MKLFQAAVCFATLAALAEGSSRGMPTITEKLESEGKSDEEAYDDAACWCKGLKETLATRQREREFRAKHLQRRKTTNRLDNERLHLEIQGHHDQIQTVNSSAMPTQKDVENRDQEFHEKALESVRKAKADLPKGTSDEVRATLDSLEDTFKTKLEAAKQDEEVEKGAPGGDVGKRLRESKAKMIRLEHESAAAKATQLAAGEASHATVSEHLEVYSAQGEADDVLSSAVGGLCDALSVESTERTRLRQQALIGSSQATHDKKHESWARSAAKISALQSPSSTAASTRTVLRGLQDSDKEGCDVAALEVAEGYERQIKTALESAELESNELTAALERTGGIRRELEQALNSAVISAHLFETASRSFLQAGAGHKPVPAMDLVHPSPMESEPSAHAPVDLKDAVAALGRAAATDLEADPPLYAETDAAERHRRTADTELLRALEVEHAVAAKALAAAKC